MALILAHIVLITFGILTFGFGWGLWRDKGNDDWAPYGAGVMFGVILAVSLITVLAQHGLIGLAP